MTLYVYKAIKPKMQHPKLNGTLIETCNAESPRGFQLANSFAKVFEVEPDDLYGEGKVKGYFHYTRFVKIYMEFESLSQFIYFANKELHNESVIPSKQFNWLFWISFGFAVGYIIYHSIK